MQHQRFRHSSMEHALSCRLCWLIVRVNWIGGALPGFSVAVHGHLCFYGLVRCLFFFFFLPVCLGGVFVFQIHWLCFCFSVWLSENTWKLVAHPIRWLHIKCVNPQEYLLYCTCVQLNVIVVLVCSLNVVTVALELLCVHTDIVMAQFVCVSYVMAYFVMYVKWVV